MLNKIIEQWLGEEESTYLFPHGADYVAVQALQKLKSRIPELEEMIVGEIEKMKEALAELEHERWSKWQKYLMFRLDFSTGKYVMSEDDFVHWNRQMHTPYSILSEKEKDSDRIEAQKTIDNIINSLKGDKE